MIRPKPRHRIGVSVCVDRGGAVRSPCDSPHLPTRFSSGIRPQPILCSAASIRCCGVLSCIVMAGPAGTAAGEATEVDHVDPRARGGATTPANLVGACRSCSKAKGIRTPREWWRDKDEQAIARGSDEPPPPSQATVGVSLSNPAVNPWSSIVDSASIELGVPAPFAARGAEEEGSAGGAGSGDQENAG